MEHPVTNICRCCLSEGHYFKDISSEYSWLGKREVYSELLTETFSITISQPADCIRSIKICEACISRLRDATEFKRQVQDCEMLYQQAPTSSTEFRDHDMKVEVKTEQIYNDNSNPATAVIFHDDTMFDDDSDDDDDDDPDDILHTKLANKMAKTASIDLFSLLEHSKLAKIRQTKEAANTDVLPPTDESTELSTQENSGETEKKKGIDVHHDKHNARMIVKYTTAYPFRLPSSFMVCVYCNEKFEFSSEYRKHMSSKHKLFRLSQAFGRTANTYAKVDCTDMRCRKCSKRLHSVNEAAEHLVSKHGIDLYLDHDLGLFPFRFADDRKYNCMICEKNLPGLMELSRHTCSHFEKYPCESCGKCYVTKATLKIHVTFSHSDGKSICRKCKKNFPSLEAKNKHVEDTKKCWPYVCWKCRERFLTYKVKTVHMEAVHGVKRTFACNECGLEYQSGSKRNRHFRLHHTPGAYMCSCCGIKFDSKREFESHRFVHTKEKLLTCKFCSKSFSREKSLKQHLWIHMEKKRFQCAPCNKQFNQRVSWRTHMKSYHPELQSGKS